MPAPGPLHAWKLRLRAALLGVAHPGGDLPDPGGLAGAWEVALHGPEARALDGLDLPVLALAELRRIEALGAGPAGGPLRGNLANRAPWPGASTAARDLARREGLDAARVGGAALRILHGMELPPGMTGAVLRLARAMHAELPEPRRALALAAMGGEARYEESWELPGGRLELRVEPALHGGYAWFVSRAGPVDRPVALRLLATDGSVDLQVRLPAGVATRAGSFDGPLPAELEGWAWEAA